GAGRAGAGRGGRGGRPAGGPGGGGGGGGGGGRGGWGGAPGGARGGRRGGGAGPGDRGGGGGGGGGGRRPRQQRRRVAPQAVTPENPDRVMWGRSMLRPYVFPCTFPRRMTDLKRSLRLADGLAMVVGMTVGAGIFRTPGL